MPTSKILWGTGNQNELVLAYPLMSVLTDRPPRESSEWIRGDSGIEDAWVTGRDYEMSCEARWIPDGGAASTPFSGATGWQTFLDWCRDKNTFRFIPNEDFPGLYIDGCYLADPMRGGGSLTPDVLRAFPLTLRNPSVDFHRALRGLLFEYAAGGSLIDPVVASFARAGTPSYHTADGFVRTVLANAERGGHWYKGAHATLIEVSRTNSCLRSEDLANATWTKTRSTISTDALLSPDGINVSADKLVEDATAGATHQMSQAITITSGETIAVTAYVRLGERTRGRLEFADGGLANGFFVNYDLAAGVVVSTGVVGAGAVAGSLIEPLANGWYRIGVWGQVNGAVTAAALFAFLADATGAVTYNGDGASGLYLWGFQVERCGTATGSAPSSYIPTTSATVTRAADASWTWPIGFKPQSMTLYARVRDFSPVTAAVTSAILQLGDAAFSAPRWYLVKASNAWSSFLGNETGGASQSTSGALSSAYGDDVELVVQLDASNPAATFVRLHFAVNGGAFAAQAPGANTRLPYNWNAQVLSFGIGASVGSYGIQQVKYAAGVRSPAEMQAL